MSPRKKVQDMLPSTRKMPLREVMPVPKSKHRHVTTRVVRADKSEPLKEFPPEAYHDGHREIPRSQPVILEQPKRPSRPMRRRPLFIIIMLIICVGAILLAINFVYASATVYVTPVKDPISVNNSFTSCKDTSCAIGNLNATSALTYSVIQIPTTESHLVIPASTGPTVSTNARGTIVLYNAYSTAAQMLVAGTHLANSAGLVYVTAKAVTIPGYKKSGATIVPGSVSAAIVANAAGPSYNIQPTDLTGDFTVVAYKGTAKAAAIYGRLDPNNSISGGSSGPSTIVGSTTLAQAYATLNQSLQSQLLAQSQALIPQGYVMFNNAYSISYKQLPPAATSTPGSLSTTTDSGYADVGVSATFYGVMFKQNDLVKAVVQAAMPSLSMATAFPNDAFSVTDLPNLVFTSKLATSSPTGPLTFTLKGSFTLTGTFSSSDLITQLLGKNVAQDNAIFEKYSTIASAHAIMSPFWRHSFPNSPQKINVIIQ